VAHAFDAGRQYKKVEAQRLSKEKSLGTTFYGWDGDTLAWETTNEESIHYFYEPDSFVPLAQGTQNHAIQLHPTPDWTDKDYSLREDPLWTQVLEPTPFDKLGFYHCDHLGTPQEITNEEGNIAWSAQYKAWGEAKEVIGKAAQSAGFRNPLRFQGQYFDHETGLHYNRYRYYDPETGRFISKDPVKYAGGLNLHVYVPNPIQWIDPLGLAGDETLKPGPYAKESITARDTSRNFTSEEREEINRLGKQHGCHTCGTTTAGTSTGNFIPDHQPPSALLEEGESQKLYPHCLCCSRKQAGQVTQAKRVKK
jgi:RHS repeat-associated protein